MPSKQTVLFCNTIDCLYDVCKTTLRCQEVLAEAFVDLATTFDKFLSSRRQRDESFPRERSAEEDTAQQERRNQLFQKGVRALTEASDGGTRTRRGIRRRRNIGIT